MNIEEALKKIGDIGIVPVVRARSFEEARQAVDAICAGGISVIEITMTVPNAPAVIREVVQSFWSVQAYPCPFFTLPKRAGNWPSPGRSRQRS